MSRGSWASIVARCDAACAARSAARRKRMDERLRRRKRAYAKRNAEKIRRRQQAYKKQWRERRKVERMDTIAESLPSEIRDAYFQSGRRVRALILEQSRDATFAFRTGEPDIHYMASIGAI